MRRFWGRNLKKNNWNKNYLPICYFPFLLFYLSFFNLNTFWHRQIITLMSFSKYLSKMKLGLAVLPMEVWADVFVYPCISREKLGQIVDQFGERTFAEKMQKLLHGCGRQTLRPRHLLQVQWGFMQIPIEKTANCMFFEFKENFQSLLVRNPSISGRCFSRLPAFWLVASARQAETANVSFCGWRICSDGNARKCQVFQSTHNQVYSNYFKNDT